jgi:hypothetical protein
MVGCRWAASAHSSSWGQLQQTARQLTLLLMPACLAQTSMMLLQSMRGMAVMMTHSLGLWATLQQQQQPVKKKC